MLLRALFVIQVLVLALPVTLMTPVFAIYALGRLWAPGALSNFTTLLLAVIGITGFWTLSASYLKNGSKGLSSIHWAAWAAACVGVLSTAIGSIFLVIKADESVSGLPYGIVGTPLLIPLLHLLTARLYHPKSEHIYE